MQAEDLGCGLTGLLSTYDVDVQLVAYNAHKQCCKPFGHV